MHTPRAKTARAKDHHQLETDMRKLFSKGETMAFMM